jgi:hypothetical protein
MMAMFNTVSLRIVGPLAGFLPTVVLVAAIVLAGCTGSGSALAQIGGGRRQGPPPEVITACEGKAPGDQVEVTRRGQTVKATCQERQGRLVAVPEGGVGKGRPGGQQAPQ